jgi:hypothetical protein
MEAEDDARITFDLPDGAGQPKEDDEVLVEVAAQAAPEDSAMGEAVEGPQFMQEDSSVCIVCKTGTVMYAPVPCACPVYCKRCAMKMATGGKCKKCGGFFGGFNCISND